MLYNECGANCKAKITNVALYENSEVAVLYSRWQTMPIWWQSCQAAAPSVISEGRSMGVARLLSLGAQFISSRYDRTYLTYLTKGHSSDYVLFWLGGGVGQPNVRRL